MKEISLLDLQKCFSELIMIFLKTFFYQAAVAIKISNLLICFCSFDLSGSILEKDILIEKLYIVLSCIFKWRSLLTLFVSI